MRFRTEDLNFDEFLSVVLRLVPSLESVTEWGSVVGKLARFCVETSVKVAKWRADLTSAITGDRDGRFGSKVGQIGPKWDKSGSISDQISVHFGHHLEKLNP